ncbi:hypothetical protein [Methylobacterium sp. D54C]
MAQINASISVQNALGDCVIVHQISQCGDLIFHPATFYIAKLDGMPYQSRYTAGIQAVFLSMAASDMVIELPGPGIPFATAPGACLIVQPMDRVGPARQPA